MEIYFANPTIDFKMNKIELILTRLKVEKTSELNCQRAMLLEILFYSLNYIITFYSNKVN